MCVCLDNMTRPQKQRAAKQCVLLCSLQEYTDDAAANGKSASAKASQVGTDVLLPLLQHGDAAGDLEES